MVKYSDFRNNFDIHPIKGDLSLITDEASITNAIKNLVLTNRYEKFWDPEKGAGIPSTLFDLANADTETLLETRIRDVITKYEPRAVLKDVRVALNADHNSYKCTIIYTPINSPTRVTVDVLLKRVR